MPLTVAPSERLPHQPLGKFGVCRHFGGHRAVGLCSRCGCAALTVTVTLSLGPHRPRCVQRLGA